MSSNITSSPRDSISVQVVEKIAETEGTDPIDLNPPLHSVIDAEALQHLFDSMPNESKPGRVSFEYNGYTVEVVADETVQVEIQDAS